MKQHSANNTLFIIYMIINLTISNVSLNDMSRIIDILNAKQEEKLSPKPYAYKLPTQAPISKPCASKPNASKSSVITPCKIQPTFTKMRAPRATIKEMILRASYEKQQKRAINWYDLALRSAIMIDLNFDIYTGNHID